MSAWFTVYSPVSLAPVTAEKLAAHLRGPHLDWYTIAESFGIEDEEVVDRAVNALRVTPATGKLGEWIEIRYRRTKTRPLVIYRWPDSDRVQKELIEVEENDLQDRHGRGVTALRKALSGVVEVVGIELGLVHLEDMGLIIAGQVAEYLADRSGGLLRDTDDRWFSVRRGVPKKLLS